MKVCELIIDENWKITEDQEEVAGIESAGLHMVLKKLAANDLHTLATSKTSFGECLSKLITVEVVGFLLFF